jgi:hypothetical protein
MAKILFVAFHGLVCLVDGGVKGGVDRGFQAYVLRDQDNVHKQMYGDFLAEQDFLPASGKDFPLHFKFSNELQPGADTLDGNLNPVVRQLPDFPVATKQNTVAVFTLPRPKKIHSRFCGELKGGVLQGSDVGRFNPAPTRISEVRFFEYNFNNEANVNLMDTDSGNVVWKCPPLATDGADQIAVFHVYDEPPTTLGSSAAIDAHNKQEFKDSMLFLSVDITIKSPATPVDAGSLTPPHTGILTAEIAPLDIRRANLITFMHKFRITGGGNLGGAGGTQVCGGGNGITM